MRDSGFTLFEVLAALFILSILAATATYSFGNLESEAKIIGDVTKIKSSLRYAQTKSMANSDLFYGIWLSQNTYALYSFTDLPANSTPGNNWTLLYLPGEESGVVQLKSELIMGTEQLICFTSLGTAVKNKKPFGGSLVIGEGRSIKITPDTGFMP